MGEETSPIGIRIRDLRGDRSQQDFADELGVSLSTLRRYESGERMPDAEFLLALLEKEAADPTWVLTGNTVGEAVMRAERTVKRVSDFFMSDEARKIRVDVCGRDHFVYPDHYRWVPVLNVRVSGGPGGTAFGENVIAFNAWRREWLAKKGLLDATLSEVTVTGESMAPELREGDVVLVNHSENEVQGGAIYVIRQGEELLVKYLQPLPGGRIQVNSENSTAFPSYIIEPADFESGECEIIGRVVRQGRER